MDSSFETATFSSAPISSCTHDPWFSIMEICQFCSNEICSSCRIGSISSSSASPTSSCIASTSLSREELEIKKYGIEIEKYQCKPCTIKQEMKIMSDTILNAIKCFENMNNFEINIVQIMTSYAVGYIIKCCNKKQECLNEISISNQFDLQHSTLKIDSDGKKILNIPYSDESEELLEDNIGCNHYVNIYGQKRQIFCNQCNENKNSSKQSPTPFMMMMTTKRFKKNHFGTYQMM